MTIVVTGGGSGGHITPILAVAAEIKKLNPKTQIVYIGQAGDDLRDIPAQDKNIDQVYSIRAGKFRRYHTEGIWQVLDLPTLILNIRDIFLALIGLWQSFWLLKKIKPDKIFIKGGFVGVPVGLAAALRKIPYTTHDSDIVPGLANRIISRWAALHAVALPKTNYSYPADKTETVGVPVHPNYQPVSDTNKQDFKRSLGLDKNNKVLLITGGGLGAQRINRAVAKILSGLLSKFDDLAVIHFVGRANEPEMRELYAKLPKKDQGRVLTRGYASDFYRYSGAADVIICRGGATNLAEFAVQKKPCIVVPNPLLTAGHQLKNAEYLAGQKAIITVTEEEMQDNLDGFANTIAGVLNSSEQQKDLGEKLAQFAHPDAARKLAMLLLNRE